MKQILQQERRLTLPEVIDYETNSTWLPNWAFKIFPNFLSKIIARKYKKYIKNYEEETELDKSIYLENTNH